MTEHKPSQNRLVETVFVVGHTHEAQAQIYSAGTEGGGGGGATFEDKGSYFFFFFFFFS